MAALESPEPTELEERPVTLLESARPGSRRPGLFSIALLLTASIAGGVAGARGANLVAPRGAIPLPAAAARVTVQEESATVGAVQEILPAVVTVVNKGTNGRAQSSGSGVVIDKAHGYVVTKSHVVEQLRTTQPARYFDVILSDGTTLAATVVGNDPSTDVAVLKVPAALPAEATLADSSQVPLGAGVVAIGSPGVPGLTTGSTSLPILQNSVTAGIVSAKGRQLPRADLRNVTLDDLLQTDAAINPGNSGGPLVWVATKQVIGLNTLVVRGTGEEGLGFAISSSTVRTIAQRLIDCAARPATTRNSYRALMDEPIVSGLLCSDGAPDRSPLRRPDRRLRRRGDVSGSHAASGA